MTPAKQIANWVINIIRPYCKKNNIDISSIIPDLVPTMFYMLEMGCWTKQEIKILFPKCLKANINPLVLWFRETTIEDKEQKLEALNKFVNDGNEQ